MAEPRRSYYGGQAVLEGVMMRGRKWMAVAVRWTMFGAIASYPFLDYALALGQSTPFVLLGLCGTFVARNVQDSLLAKVRSLGRE